MPAWDIRTNRTLLTLDSDDLYSQTYSHPTPVSRGRGIPADGRGRRKWPGPHCLSELLDDIKQLRTLAECSGGPCRLFR